MQPILVERNSEKKDDVIKELIKRADPKNDWPQIIIFPEGVCTNRECLVSFKEGAFIPGLPVQPVIIEFKNEFDSVTWTFDDFSVFKVFFYTLCQFHNNMEITVETIFTMA